MFKNHTNLSYRDLECEVLHFYVEIPSVATFFLILGDTIGTFLYSYIELSIDRADKLNFNYSDIIIYHSLRAYT